MYFQHSTEFRHFHIVLDDGTVGEPPYICIIPRALSALNKCDGVAAARSHDQQPGVHTVRQVPSAAFAVKRPHKINNYSCL